MERTTTLFKVSYKVSETIFSTNFVILEGICTNEEKTIEARYNLQGKEVVAISEATESDREAAERKGMPIVTIKVEEVEEALRNKAEELIEEDDELFCHLVEELDNYNGFADGYRCFDMYELDDFYYNTPASKLLEDLTEDFHKGDEWFYFSIWGLESTNDRTGLYKDHTDAEEVLDNILNNLHGVYIDCEELEELLEALDEAI